MQEKETMLLEVGNILKKSAVEQVCPQKDQFLSNIFTVKKKDGGNRPVINLKELNQYIPFLHFKMESLQSLKTLLQKKRVHVQTRPQGRIFISPTFSGRPKESDVSMGRNSVRVSLPVLWPCINPICFHKTPKDPHGSFKKHKHTHNNLFGRHVDYWQNKGRDYSSTRYSQSFTSVSGIFYKSEKVSDDTSSGDTISGNDSQFKSNDYYLPQKKLQSIKQMCQDIYQNAETTVLELTKVLGQLKSTILAVLPAKLHCRFLQQQQIQVLKKNGSYESRVLLNKESQLELLWWVKNIEICNGRTLIQLSTQVLLQTDASLTS